MLESGVQRVLVTGCRSRGWIAVKMGTESGVGIPDILVIADDGRFWLVEVKTERGRVGPAQAVWHAKYHQQTGRHVVVLKGVNEVRAWLREQDVQG